MPARKNPAVATTPFANYAREHGFPKLADLPGSIGKMLSAKPKKIAPNSPMLEELAKFMKRPLSELQEFAKGPPMAERWIKKFRKQIEHGTVPRGEKSANRRRGHAAGAPSKNATTALGRLIQAHEYTVSKLAAEIGVKAPAIWRLSMGDQAPNHPLLPKLAEALDEPVGKLAAMQSGRPLKPGMLEKVARQYGIALNGRQSHDRKPGKAVVLHVGKPVATGDDVPVRNGTHGPKGKYNRLGAKRTPQNTRQSVRALIATINVAIMKGDSHIPPVPVEDMYAIVQLLVAAMGIRVNVMIDPSFPTLFDPRK